VNNQQIISNYESLSALTGQMRVAATEGEWDRLVGLEQQCSRQVDHMKSADTGPLLDETARQHKIRLIRKILADDAEIRNRTTTWMSQLQGIMQSNRQEQRLSKTYGAM